MGKRKFNLEVTQEEADEARAVLPKGASTNDVAWRILSLRVSHAQSQAEADAARVLMRLLLDAEGKPIPSDLTNAVPAVFSRQRYAAYDAANDFVRGVRFAAVVDGHTTPYCLSIHDRSIAKSDPHYATLRPPFQHAAGIECRTMAVPVLETDAAWRFDEDWDAWLNTHDSMIPPAPFVAPPRARRRKKEKKPAAPEDASTNRQDHEPAPDSG